MSYLDTNPNQEKYKLNNEQRKEYLEKVIAFFTSGKHSCPEGQTPTLVFVSGQTGCGKTQVIKILEKENPNQVVYSFDEIRAMHPKYQQACEELNGDTHSALFPDTDWACKELLNYCRENRLNVVKEASMRRKEDIIDTAVDFRNYEYSIDIRLMAVPSIDSYVGTLERYVSQLLDDVNARWITREAHDVTFNKIPETLKCLIDKKIFDRITIYKRGNITDNQLPQEIYSTEHRQFASPLEALNYGRAQYTESYKPDFWDKVKRLIITISKYSPTRVPELKDYIIGCYQRNTGNEIVL